MKRCLLPFPSRIWLVPLFGVLVGCGATTSNPAAAGAPNGGGGNAGSPETTGGGGTAARGSGGMTTGGVSAGATYAGVILAMVTEKDGTSAYTTRAVFAMESRPTIGGYPQCRCGGTRRGLPLPEKPPDAGEITITSTESPVLATLVPDPFADGGGVLHGMTDLGWGWSSPLSNYEETTSQPWQTGDSLQVVAKGNEVEPFGGTLRAGPALVDVSPAIGSAPVVIDHTQPFTISWTPADGGDATVFLSIPQAQGVCFCDVPDSAGQLVVDPALLTPTTGQISLSRFTISTVNSPNASVDLVGAVVQRGAVQVR